LKKLNSLKIITAFSILPRFKALNQNSFHRGYHDVYIYTGVGWTPALRQMAVATHAV
jgi:hypothetical protein